MRRCRPRSSSAPLRLATLMASAGDALAIFVRTPGQAGDVCSAEPVVPNNLVRVWIGGACPSKQDVVSLLMAVMMLEPARIIYYVDYRFPLNCMVPIAPSLRSTVSGNLTDCYAKLGVEFHRIQYTNESEFGRATADYAVHSIGRWANGAPKALVPEYLTDLVRLYALRQHGGFYFDSDAFVTSPELRQWRRCPAAISTCNFDREDAELSGPRRARPSETSMPDQAEWLQRTQPSVGLNNGAMFMARRSTFSDAWWAHFKTYKATWQDWHPYCCYWPQKYVSKHSDKLAVMTDMVRSFPFELMVDGVRMKNATGTLWKRLVPRMLERRGTHAVHMVNFKKRRETGDVINALLEWAIVDRGGEQALSAPLQQCIATFRASRAVPRRNRTRHG